MDDSPFHQKRIDVLFTVSVYILVPDLQFGIQTLFQLFSEGFYDFALELKRLFAILNLYVVREESFHHRKIIGDHVGLSSPIVLIVYLQHPLLSIGVLEH